MVQVPGDETDVSKLMTAVRGGVGPDVYHLDRFTTSQRAAGSGRGERTLVVAGCPAVLLRPVPGGSGAAPFLLQLACEEAQALRMEPLRREVVSELWGAIRKPYS